ncbi:hypothetical protein BV25DRAFT_1779694, partial [Artomyces pyxidatus]
PTVPKGMQDPGASRKLAVEEDSELKGDVDEVEAYALATEMMAGQEPRTIEKARRSPDWQKWEATINDELERMERMGIWKLVPKP